MTDEWCYEAEGIDRGPVSAAALRQLARSGRIVSSTLIWRLGTDRRCPLPE